MKYTVFGVEEVYDAFDDYEHANPLAPVVVEADSLEEAKSAGTSGLWKNIQASRQAHWSSGEFVPCITQIVDSNGYLVFQRTSGLVRVGAFPSDERKAGQTADQPHQRARVCFLSYNSRDERFSRQLFDALLLHRFYCWFAPERHEMPSLERVEDTALEIRLAEAIHAARVVLVVISAASARSDWVRFEVAKAVEHNRTAMTPHLVGLEIDDAPLDSPWIRDFVAHQDVLDFKNWRDQSWFCAQTAALADHIAHVFPNLPQ